MFRANIFVVYCDPNDEKNYDKVLKTLADAKKHFSINLVSSENGGELTINREKDIVFVLSHSPSLMFFNFEPEEGSPQGLLLPFGDSYNCMDLYLKNLKTFDDLSIKDWIKKAENAETEFKIDFEKDDQQT